MRVNYYDNYFQETSCLTLCQAIMKNGQVFRALVLVVLIKFSQGSQNGISLENNGYINIIVSVTDKVPQDVNVVDDIEV